MDRANIYETHNTLPETVEPRYELLEESEAGQFTADEFECAHDLDEHESRVLRALDPEEMVTFGGGAAAEYTLRRVA